MLRTLPAVMADALMADLGVAPDALAAITAAYHWSFALMQVPLGVALDRYGVKRTALAIMCVALAGALLAAAARGPGTMLLAQVLMGAGTAGGLLAPMTYAARALDPARFGLWSGIVLGVGNTGMLLSATPAAWLTEVAGWRAGFLAGAGVEAAAILAVLALLPQEAPAPTGRTIGQDAREVLRLFASAALRAPVIIALVSFSATVAVRGLWGGPWLMGHGLDRIGAGNALLALTVALAVGPFVAGALDQGGRRGALVALGHGLAGMALAAALLLPALAVAPLVAFGLLVSTQALVFAITRAAVPKALTGRALSAVNLSFFLGAAVLQPMSGLAAAVLGPAGGIGFFAAALLLGALGFALAGGLRPR
jgi:predicted MFS family arabinose efflux permease